MGLSGLRFFPPWGEKRDPERMGRGCLCKEHNQKKKKIQDPIKRGFKQLNYIYQELNI